MACAKLLLADGVNNNKLLCFVGEYYDLWKIHMQIYLEEQGEDTWDAVQNRPYIPTIIINNEKQPKDDDNKKSDVCPKDKEHTCINIKNGRIFLRIKLQNSQRNLGYIETNTWRNWRSQKIKIKYFISRIWIVHATPWKYSWYVENIHCPN